MSERLSTEELRDVWRILDKGERLDGFRLMAPDDGEEFFFSLSTADQLELVDAMRPSERRLWARSLAPDDAADLIQEAEDDQRAALMALFDEPTQREVRMLLAYAEDDAGGLMSPRYARVRPEMTVDEAILYMRRQAHLNLETIYYGYVLDGPRLLGVVSFRDLFQAAGAAPVREIMHADLVTVQDDTDQEAVSAIMAEHDLVAVPVVDAEGHMKGIVTIDDIVDVVQEEATEDMQKIGGTEALEAPYLEVGFVGMLQKRAGWLTILFLAQLFSITVMTFYEESIAKMAVLAAFIPLIISSGGNSGSQATTLVTRAMALQEVRLRDWMRVFSMEVLLGVSLGLILASIGFARILFWPGSGNTFGEHYVELGFAVATSVLCVVVWGTVSGSMLPLLLRRAGFDPASASAPLVATLVDIFGLVIYFNVARLWLAEAGL
jgi:magnesium transporter